MRVLCWHSSLHEYFGLELADAKKINRPVGRYEEKSQYLIRGFASKDGNGLQPYSSHFSCTKASCDGSHHALHNV